MEITPFKNIQVRHTEHWEKFYKHKDTIRATLHYQDRIHERSSMTLGEAMVCVRNAIAKGRIKKSAQGAYLAIDNGVHVIELEGYEVTLITYYKTERQARLEGEQKVL